MLGEGLILVSPALRSEFQARLDRVKTWLKKKITCVLLKGAKNKKQKKPSLKGYLLSDCNLNSSQS